MSTDGITEAVAQAIFNELSDAHETWAAADDKTRAAYRFAAREATEAFQAALAAQGEGVRVSESERRAIAHAQWQVDHAADGQCCFDYDLVNTWLALTNRLLATPTPAPWNEAVEAAIRDACAETARKTVEACAKLAEDGAEWAAAAGDNVSPQKLRGLAAAIRALTRPAPAPEETRK